MKKLKIFIVIVFCLSFSLDAYSETRDELESTKVKQIIELDSENFQAEQTFEEDASVDIPNEELEDTLKEAYTPI